MSKTICQYPIGTQDDKAMFCDRDAAHEVEGFSFCELHTMMAVRGCLDIQYTDSTTPREIIKDNTQPRFGSLDSRRSSTRRKALGILPSSTRTTRLMKWRICKWDTTQKLSPT